MRRICVLLLFYAVLFKYWLDTVGWWWSWVLYSYWFSVVPSTFERGIFKVYSYKCEYVYFSFLFYQFCFKYSATDFWCINIWNCCLFGRLTFGSLYAIPPFLVNFFVLKSTLSDMIMFTLFPSTFVWNYFSHPSLSICLTLYLKSIPYEQHRVGWCL